MGDGGAVDEKEASGDPECEGEWGTEFVEESVVYDKAGYGEDVVDC